MIEVAGGIILVLIIVATLFNLNLAFAFGKLIFALACAAILVAVVAKTVLGG